VYWNSAVKQMNVQMLAARFLTIGVEFTEKQKEEVRMTYLVMK
jgi:hypothetical protein